MGAVICLCQRNDEGARRESSAVHLLAPGGNTLTLALPLCPPPFSTTTPPARFMTHRVGPGLLGLRTFVNLVAVAVHHFFLVRVYVRVRALNTKHV